MASTVTEYIRNYIRARERARVRILLNAMVYHTTCIMTRKPFEALSSVMCQPGRSLKHATYSANVFRVSPSAADPASSKMSSPKSFVGHDLAKQFCLFAVVKNLLRSFTTSSLYRPCSAQHMNATLSARDLVMASLRWRCIML
jgi:hypothetical protein